MSEFGDGRDHAWKGWRESVIRGISCRTDPIHYDTDLLRSDLRSNGSDGAVLGEEDTRTIEKVLGMGLSAGLIVAVVLAEGSPWHAGDTDADLYL